MSTRSAKNGSAFRQERFTSSTALKRGVLGNLVSRRVETLPDADDRELVWWLQELTLRDLNGPHFACTSFPSWTSEFQQPGDNGLERITAKLIADFPDNVRGDERRARRELPAFLEQFCLDPTCSLDQFRPFKSLRDSLHSCKTRMEAAYSTSVADTGVARIVREALDFCLSQKGIVLIEGMVRAGKSFSAQHWSLERPGRVRYVSLSAYTDETTFFRLIARSLGTASSAMRKAIEVRQRVEDALKSRGLMLVIDECQYLLPSTARPQGAPDRLNYVMADLDNRGVAVALIGTTNFSLSLANLGRKLPHYDPAQFYGRLRLHRRLPDALTEEDLFAVAAVVAPDVDEAARMLLVGHALTAKGRIAALEHIAKRARFFAETEGIPMGFLHVNQAIEESSPSQKSAFPVPARSTREAVAIPPRPPRGARPVTPFLAV